MIATLWLLFAVAAMIVIFVACALIVTAGVRMLERVLERRSRRREEARAT